MNNLATVAYTTGHRAAVHSGGRFETVLTQLNAQIEALVSRLTPERARILQGQKNALLTLEQRLPKARQLELNTLLKGVYQDAEYRRLTDKKARRTHDYLHKLSRSLVDQAVARGIELLVVGRNVGWKNGLELGRKQNRRVCQVAHASLLEMLRYKAQAAGIAVVTTEESYTSKTSFVNNEALTCFDEVEHARSLGLPLPSAARSGKRSASDRHRFIHKNRTDRWRIVHADVNGAFNIIRKVFKDFRYHAGLTLKYVLYRLSPRIGLARMTATVSRNLG